MEQSSDHLGPGRHPPAHHGSSRLPASQLSLACHGQASLYLISTKAAAADGPQGDSSAPAAALPPLVIPESGLDDADWWMLHPFATLQRRCSRPQDTASREGLARGL